MTLLLMAGLFMSLSWDAPSLSASTPTMPSASPSQRPSTISLDYATYQGMPLNNGVDQYLGMRFAKAPLGNLRFRAPQDPEHDSEEVQDATKVRLVPVRGVVPGAYILTNRVQIVRANLCWRRAIC